ncbi:glycosyltransferase family 4 protein [Candidatus Acidulodesulfobacterium sp. H_13]|uniref:glycosyltransferase family 4 protein n=1 Tax=Candidatus Acidulodesulfobacterium sp. H_13 TaxID=3395470 RepID=UPI003AF57F5A
MKIFFDGRLIHYAGVGRYERELIAGLLKLNPKIVFYITGDEVIIKNYIKEFKLNEKNFYIINTSIKKYTFKEQFLLIKNIKKFKNEVNVFFFPHFNIPFLYVPKNSVAVIHDLTFFHFPEYFGRIKTFFARIVLEGVLKKANKIITISNYVENDIIDMFGKRNGRIIKSIKALNASNLRKKIIPIYPGYSARFKPASREEIIKFKRKKNLSRYILYCGNRKKHKNLTNLIHAFNDLKKENEFNDLKLILIGKRFTGSNKPDFIDIFIKKFNIKGVESLNYVSDDELNLYYSASNAFVFVSLSEGFGFAPLEALASGAPSLILADNSVLPEIFKDMAYYVNPYDIGEISAAVKNALRDNGANHDKDKIDRILNGYSYELLAKNIYNVLLDVSSL